MKSEPDVFGIDHLRKMKRSPWDGVRNYQARNHLRAMQVGDQALFYHSNAKPSGVAGLCEIVKAAYPDHTAWDPASPYHDPKDGPEVQRWSMVDVRFTAMLPRFLALEDLRRIPELAGMVLLTNSRLSVQPVSDEHFRCICALGGR